jgi:hypothetical protein
MCKACAGCELADSSKWKSKELLYTFPMSAPFRYMHCDAYMAGKDQGFDGEVAFMNCLDGMTAYAISEPLREMTSNEFAKAIMKISLQHGIPHTLVVDKDTKFMGVFLDTVKLLNLNIHVASGGHHDPVLTERIHKYYNKALKIFTNERGTNRSAASGIHLLNYAWNSIPVVGTDIIRSLPVKGRIFQFPIDYSKEEYFRLNCTPQDVENFARDQAILLKCSREIYRVLISEQRAWHREYINAQRPDPLLYKLGSIVFARRQVRSNLQRGQVGKLMFQHTGPWTIIEKLDGGSYKIQHNKSKKIDKKHSSDLSPCPRELIPFQPLSGPDNSFSQLQKQIKPNPFSDAGINGYTPSHPWEPSHKQPQASISIFAYSQQQRQMDPFPTLAELNDEIDGVHTRYDIGLPNADDTDQNPHITDTFHSEVLEGINSSLNNITQPAQADDHPLPPGGPIQSDSSHINLPSLPDLIASIIKSDDKLFFINVSHTSQPSDYCEWQLVQLNFDKTMNDHPQCIHDGKFLVEFLLPHPNDSLYAPPNQRFWTEYKNINNPSQERKEYHLVRPSNNVTKYCKQKNLTAHSIWTYLSHSDIYLLGPFNFATLNGRKSIDRIDHDIWQNLSKLSSHYKNQPPSPVASAYSIHIDTHFHSTHQHPQATSGLVTSITPST